MTASTASDYLIAIQEHIDSLPEQEREPFERSIVEDLAGKGWQLQDGGPKRRIKPLQSGN